MTRGIDTLERFEGQPWSPARFTAPLVPQFGTAGPKLAALAQRHFRTPEDGLIQLDNWQRALINHVLERYPADWPVAALRGHLRYRQVLISMARQNGKSLLGAIFALFGLLQHVLGPSVVGLATSVEQANVVYRRVRFAVDNDPSLGARLKATGTRGIMHRDGSGDYQVKPSLTEGLQSVPITLAVADELHLMRRVLWDSIVQGQRAQQAALVIGITTAGDDESDLLKHLYEVADRAIAGHRERFGAFIWEAPEGATIWTPGAMEAASPGIACGRIQLETARADIQDQPLPDQQRYGLNQFVVRLDPWFQIDKWLQAPHTTGLDPDDLDTGLVIGVARTESWEYATLVASAKTDQGDLRTEVVATLVDPDQDELLALCNELAGNHPVTFAMDSATLSGLGKALRRNGHEVYILTQNEVCQASAGGFAAIQQGRLGHDGHRLTIHQWQRARRAISGESWRISGRGQQADAVLATIVAAHVADATDETTQLWV